MTPRQGCHDAWLSARWISGRNVAQFFHPCNWIGQLVQICAHTNRVHHGLLKPHCIWLQHRAIWKHATRRMRRFQRSSRWNKPCFAQHLNDALIPKSQRLANSIDNLLCRFAWHRVSERQVAPSNESRSHLLSIRFYKMSSTTIQPRPSRMSIVDNCTLFQCVHVNKFHTQITNRVLVRVKESCGPEMNLSARSTWRSFSFSSTT